MLTEIDKLTPEEVNNKYNAVKYIEKLLCRVNENPEKSELIIMYSRTDDEFIETEIFGVSPMTMISAAVGLATRGAVEAKMPLYALQDLIVEFYEYSRRNNNDTSN